MSVIFKATATCEFCEAEIMFVNGFWVDQLIEEQEVDVTFAAACGEGSEYHRPKATE